VRDRGLREATDRAIFVAARDAGAIILTKDSDFVTLLERYGSPADAVDWQWPVLFELVRNVEPGEDIYAVEASAQGR
jgi:hypothetical protein